jgi:hypothetical protein
LSSKRSSTPEAKSPPAAFLRVLDRVELEVDEDVVRVVDAAQDALHTCLLACAGLVLVELRPPAVVVADVDSRDDKCSHVFLSPRPGRVAPERDRPNMPAVTRKVEKIDLVVNPAKRKERVRPLSAE